LKDRCFLYKWKCCEGFIHDKKAEERIVAKIRQIKGVKSVKSNLKVEEKR
jgi:hypothetical protein